MERIDQAASLVLGRLDWQPDTPPDSPKLNYYNRKGLVCTCGRV